MKPLFITYWWGKDKKPPKTNYATYKELAECWEANCKKFNLDFIAVYMPRFEGANYQDSINFKPQFIIQMIKKYKRPVVYLDLDITILKNPKFFFNKPDIDLMFVNWNSDKRITGTSDPFTLETAGFVYYFSDSKQSLTLLNHWNKKLKMRKGKADDRVLAMVFHETRALLWCRVNWLPIEYYYVPQFYDLPGLKKKAVIGHLNDFTSEEEAFAFGSSRNRIPANYKLANIVRDRSQEWKCLREFKFKFKFGFETSTEILSLKSFKPDDVLKHWSYKMQPILLVNPSSSRKRLKLTKTDVQNYDLIMVIKSKSKSHVMKCVQVTFDPAGDIFLNPTHKTVKLMQNWKLTKNINKAWRSYDMPCELRYKVV
jgi:hypothetical protein